MEKMKITADLIEEVVTEVIELNKLTLKELVEVNLILSEGSEIKFDPNYALLDEDGLTVKELYPTAKSIESSVIVFEIIDNAVIHDHYMVDIMLEDGSIEELDVTCNDYEKAMINIDIQSLRDFTNQISKNL